MSLRFVIYPAVDADRLERLREAAPDAEWTNASSSDQALAQVASADAFLGKITPSMLAKARRLRWVQSFTASLEHYIFPALVGHPCVLTNMRGLFGDVIADQVMGYILCFARNLHTYIRQQTNAEWRPVGGEEQRVDFAAGPGTTNALDRGTIFLPEATLGIVGFGGIGSEIARRARCFGMQVRAVDRFPERAQRVEGIEVEPLDRLKPMLASSHFVVIAAPHTPETERLFDRGLLACMRPGGFLINVGRGAIVVLDDLVECLRAGQPAGAALDVFEQEPLPRDHPLWSFPNVILTPHTAGYSTAIAPRHLALLVENVARFVNRQPLRNQVDKQLWF